MRTSHGHVEKKTDLENLKPVLFLLLTERAFIVFCQMSNLLEPCDQEHEKILDARRGHYANQQGRRKGRGRHDDGYNRHLQAQYYIAINTSGAIFNHYGPGTNLCKGDQHDTF